LLLIFAQALDGNSALGADSKDRTVIKKAPSSLPFKVGEKLTYKIEWFFIDAGIAVSEIREEVVEDGRDLLHFSLHTYTANTMAHIWTMQDYFHSYWDIKTRSTKRFTVKIRESTYKKDKLLVFDHKKGIVTVTKDKDKPKEFKGKKGAQDFFTAGHYTRLLPLKKGAEYHYPVFEDDKNYDAKVKVLKKERIKVMDGEIDTIKIHPIMSFEGAFVTKGDLYVWLTDDHYRAPVKFKLVTLFGPIYLTLIEYKGVDLKIIREEKKKK
jgi:hypothetical protein